MRILFATAEFSPVVTVGGLGSAAAGLVRELRTLGHEVLVAVPDYQHYALERETSITIEGPEWCGPIRIRQGWESQAGEVAFIGTDAIERPHPYLDGDGNGWSDNDTRFFAFSAGVAHLCTEQMPDIVHVNDWHTAAVLCMLDPNVPTATVLSIHNLAYQGTCDVAWLAHLGPNANAAERDGACNPLAGAIALADAVVVVSPNYRSEILEPEHACGLHDLLTARADTIYGIRNGVETDVWNPANDPHFSNHFTADDLTPKLAVQHALRAELGLAQPEAAERRSLAVVVSRLAHQKGIDELLAILPMLHGIPSQLAILGSGDAWLAGELRNAASHDPSNVAFVEGFVDGLGHRMIAGGDFLMMPSRFEPCGLTQMQAMRYGTTPVVAGVGGLVDTVIDDDEHPKTGTGFVAANHQSLAMLDAWHRAQRAWRIPQRRRAIQRRGMQADWSWNQPASAHVSLYEHLVSTRSTYAQ